MPYKARFLNENTRFCLNVPGSPAYKPIPTARTYPDPFLPVPHARIRPKMKVDVIASRTI